VLFNGVPGTNLNVIDHETLDVNTPSGSIRLETDDGPYPKLGHGSVTNGPFQAGEIISGLSSGHTAVVIEVGLTYLLVANETGVFTNSETISGGLSSATATITSTLTDLPFQVGEPVTGLTSSVLAIVRQVDPLRVDTLSGAFQAGEDVFGSVTGARVTLDGAMPMNGFVDVEVSNSWGSRITGNKLTDAFEYTS